MMPQTPELIMATLSDDNAILDSHEKQIEASEYFQGLNDVDKWQTMENEILERIEK